METFFILYVNKWGKKEKKTLSEQFQNQTQRSYKESKSLPLRHKHVPAHFPDLVQAIQ